MDGKTLTDDKDIADGINNYFCTIGSKIRSKIKWPGGHFTDYLKNKINNIFFISPVVEAEVSRELAKLNPKKASGPLYITTKIVTSCASQLTAPLTRIYNRGINEACFPGVWKLAKVVALYKKKSHFLPENYRPISLLNCFGKIFEKLISKQMVLFIEKYKILYTYQYGFRGRHSTSLALIDIVDKIKDALDKNEYVLGIFLDITKAFDSVNHEILYKKLEHYGFRGHFLYLIKSYLSNRSQYLCINNTKSDQRNISYGVPQGSILGPLLFLIDVNDIQYVDHNSGSRLFADDTAIFYYDKDPNTLSTKGENIMKVISKWFALNKLALSLGKSNFVLFHGNRKDAMNQITQLQVGNDIITRTDKTKYIGLTLDEKLSWGPHIDEICNNLCKYFSVFYNIRNSMTAKTSRTVYYACIYSRIKYSIEVFGSASDSKMKKLQMMQNKLMKLLTNKDRMYGTVKLHNELDILQIQDIFETSVLNFVFKCVKDVTIEPFKNYFTFRHEHHHYNLRNNEHITTNKILQNMGKNTTHFKGASLWNDLSDDVRSITGEKEFKRVLSKMYKSRYIENS